MYAVFHFNFNQNAKSYRNKLILLLFALFLSLFCYLLQISVGYISGTSSSRVSNEACLLWFGLVCLVHFAHVKMCSYEFAFGVLFTLIWLFCSATCGSAHWNSTLFLCIRPMHLSCQMSPQTMLPTFSSEEIFEIALICLNI